MQQPLFRLPALVVLYLSFWLGAELVAFAFVVHLVGFIGAIALCIATSLAGFATLRRIGLSAAGRLRQMMALGSQGKSIFSKETLIDGTLSSLGAFLLILPGFASDLVGLALAAPSFRLWAASRLKARAKGELGRHSRDEHLLIELAPREWSRHEGSGPAA